MYNTIIAVGHLVSDPQSRQTNTGKTIATMRICISEKQDKNPCFIDVEAWEKTAEVCVQYLAKGRQILVEGSLALSSWTDKEGKTQNKNFIRAKTVKFLGDGQKKDSATAPAASSQSRQAPVDNDEVDDDIPF